MLYNVGEVAKMLGLAPSTLRYYDREGLLPFVERTSGGFRMFSDKDIEWLAIIECLKQSGLSIKEIQTYIEQCAQGDSTILQRKELFAKRREVVLEQIRELEQTLDMLDYKMWFYTVAEEAGTTAIHETMPESEIPERMLDIKRNSRYYKLKQQAKELHQSKDSDKEARQAVKQPDLRVRSSRELRVKRAQEGKKTGKQSA